MLITDQYMLINLESAVCWKKFKDSHSVAKIQPKELDLKVQTSFSLLLKLNCGGSEPLTQAERLLDN